MNASQALQRFEDLPFPAEVELGSLVMTIGEIFELHEGAVLRTDHLAGAPVALQVGGVELATADIVVVEDSLSIRITRLSENTKPSSGGNGIS
jgi:flagellar motor switch/type III secretory pathway protein FliN